MENKIKTLLEISDEFLFVGDYSHTGMQMWKIKNIFTKYKEERLVLCAVEDGFEKALDLAIQYLTQRKEEFFRS